MLPGKPRRARAVADSVRPRAAGGSVRQGPDDGQSPPRRPVPHAHARAVARPGRGRAQGRRFREASGLEDGGRHPDRTALRARRAGGAAHARARPLAHRPTGGPPGRAGRPRSRHGRSRRRRRCAEPRLRGRGLGARLRPRCRRRRPGPRHRPVGRDALSHRDAARCRRARAGGRPSGQDFGRAPQRGSRQPRPRSRPRPDRDARRHRPPRRDAP